MICLSLSIGLKEDWARLGAAGRVLSGDVSSVELAEAGAAEGASRTARPALACWYRAGRRA